MIYSDIAYLYDGSLEGFLTVVFTIYERRQLPDAIAIEEGFQPSFDQYPLFVPMDKEKARRVQKGILQKAGREVWKKVLYAFLGTHPSKERLLFSYIQQALEVGPKILYDLANSTIIEIERIAGHTSRELERWMGFLRFSKISNGIYYAPFEPQDDVLPLLMPHFVQRFSSHPFLIHDLNRHMVGAYDMNQWILIPVSEDFSPILEEDNQFFEDAWQSFFQAISNPERENKKLQQNHMPKRYRMHMTEFFVAAPPSKKEDLAVFKQGNTK